MRLLNAKIILLAIMSLLIFITFSPVGAAEKVIEDRSCVSYLYTYKADVVAVYDADTITVNIDLGFGIWKHNEKLRLGRINAPEVRGKEKKQGIISRDYLRDQILGEQVIITTTEKGKYGRWIAEVYDLNCVNINDLLVKEGLAKFRNY